MSIEIRNKRLVILTPNVRNHYVGGLAARVAQHGINAKID
jgi:hypothetical protein